MPRTWPHLLLLLALAAGTASARDVELYERPDFRGTRLTLDAAEPDLGRYGIGQSVSSVVVVRGAWEFCTLPQYRGSCITVGPGRYDRLPPALDNRLASLRPAGGPPPTGEPPRGPAIVLRAGDGISPELRLVDAVADLRSRGYNDATVQVDVLAGQWELCSDGGFGGHCQRFGPGRHELPPALRERLSSLRPLGGAGPQGPGGPRPQRPDGPPGQPWPGATPAIVLYEHREGGGASLPLWEAVTDLGGLGFNDRASSVEVLRGRWQLCRHAGFGGDCIVLGPGRHALEGRLHDGVSSLRPLHPRDERHFGGAPAVTLHDSVDLRGRTLFVDGTVGNLRDHGFNDRAIAVEVHAGEWELCSDAGFRGRCLRLRPGWHRLPEGLGGALSSLRPR